MHRKQILTLGPMKYRSDKPVVNIDSDFVSTLQRNLAADVVGFVPVVRYNRHTEDPSYHVGDVKGIVIEGDGVFAEFDLDSPVDLKEFDALYEADAYPMISVDYMTPDGTRTGPALLHVLLRGRPVVTGSSGL